MANVLYFALSEMKTLYFLSIPTIYSSSLGGFTYNNAQQFKLSDLMRKRYSVEDARCRSWSASSFEILLIPTVYRVIPCLIQFWRWIPHVFRGVITDSVAKRDYLLLKKQKHRGNNNELDNDDYVLDSRVTVSRDRWLELHVWFVL
ncbi:hypothetical protein WG66_005441 [Moniliophthora roreri]|nr:hypothetical protein WG66_005441 [Moniliophthora roreri]